MANLLSTTITTTSGSGLTITTNDVTTLKMTSSGGGVKNWGFATTNLAASDFGIYQSNAAGGDPINAGSAKLYFKGDGKVGIGTTSPETELHVIGEISVPSYIRLTGAGANNAFISESWGINLNGVTTHPVQVRGASFSVGYSLGGGTSYGTNNLFVAGSVGIGTTSPDTRLQVYQSFSIRTDTTGDAFMRLYRDAVPYGHFYMDRTNSKVTIGSIESVPFTFDTAGTERMRITDAGSVGIGTTGPLGTLDIGKSSATPSLVIGNSAYPSTYNSVW
jgi:hypothetical protein